MGHNLDLVAMYGLPEEVTCLRCGHVSPSFFDDYDVECGDYPFATPGMIKLSASCGQCGKEWVENFKVSIAKPGQAAESELSALRARVAELEAECDKARANYQFMVERAADEKLDGYRELGARAAAAENECDRLRARLATLEAPPVVPEGWEVRKVFDVWAAQHVCGYKTNPPSKALRALAWAIEHDTRPPHAGDKEGADVK